MTRYALVRPDNTVDRLQVNIDPTVQTKPGFRWLSCPQVSIPVIDPSLEVIEGPTYSVGESSVTETWTKRNKTTQELDAEKDVKVSAIDKLQFLIAFDMENRMRALEAKPSVTAAQYRAALKARL